MAKRTLRHHLRIHTQEVHEELHSLDGFHPLATGTITPDAFQSLMTGLAGFYKSLDSRMLRANARYHEETGGYCYRPRAILFPEPARAAVLPAIDSLAALAGAAYVVDGAVLGGRVLGNGPLPFARHPYWDWCASDGPAIWRAACKMLEHLDRCGIAHAEVLDAAQSTFETFRDTMLDHMTQGDPVQIPA